MAPVAAPIVSSNGTVIISVQRHAMTGQLQPSAGNQLENPGFPFFIPGVAGARPPHPPLDFAPDGAGGFLDGGLPRHVETGGSVSYEKSRSVRLEQRPGDDQRRQLPETGTDAEKAAINFFGTAMPSTSFPWPDGSPPAIAQMTLNHALWLPGEWLAAGSCGGGAVCRPGGGRRGQRGRSRVKRTYKAAAIQLDVTLNKKRWHFPQQRMLTLWKDVQPTFTFNPVTPQVGVRRNRCSSVAIPATSSSTGTPIWCPTTTSSTISRCVRRPTSWASTFIW